MRAGSLLLLSLSLSFATAAFALSPSDLNPAMTSVESAYYDTIKADPAAAQNFSLLGITSEKLKQS